jgi:GAF domain-containing protein
MGVPAVDQTIARLLHLLATEAPWEAFEQLAEIVEASPPGPDRDEMLLAIARAGRIRESLAHRKRREKETHALIESARDLASLRDVEEVLDAVVRRARQLLGTDATYLALRDPDRGDVYMRVTHGTVTRGIEQVRQPLGRGVGGRIIATGEPFATSDYVNDTRIDRDEAVTHAVAEDGIVSIAGVPMRVGDEVIGALFVANRYERWFDDYEIDLLGSLADHASIVIDNARLFAQTEVAAGRLCEANAELTRQGRELERAAAAHEQLMPIALRRADLGELVHAVAAMLGGTLAVVTDDHAVRASAGTAEVPTRLPAADGDTVAARQVPDRPDVWTVPVRAGEVSFGNLVLVAAVPPSAADVRMLERAAQTAALLLLMDREVSAAERQVRGELIDDLLAEREPDWAAFGRRARRFGAVDFALPHTVLVLDASGIARRHLLRVATDHAVRRGGIATEHAARVVLLLPCLEPSELRSVPHRLRRAAGGVVTAGVAGPATSAQEVRNRHREAERCLRLALALGRDGEAVSLTDLGVLGLVLESTSVTQLQALLARTVDPLVAYDREHNALLVDTLDAYFTAGQNPRAAAKALQVHPNTVYQRLDRIDQVLDPVSWRDPQGALRMQLAVELHRVRTHVPLETLVGPASS